MSTEEFNALKEGDIVWYFELTLSTAGNVSRQLVAKLEKRKDKSCTRIELCTVHYRFISYFRS